MFDKSGKGQGGGGGQPRWIKQFINENIINFANLDKRVGNIYPPKVDNLVVFCPSQGERLKGNIS